MEIPGMATWVVVGALAGVVVNLLTGGKLKGGCVGVALVGMTGAVLGGVVFGFLGGEPVTGVNLYSVVVAVVGSLLLLWVVGRTTRP